MAQILITKNAEEILAACPDIPRWFTVREHFVQGTQHTSQTFYFELEGRVQASGYAQVIGADELFVVDPWGIIPVVIRERLGLRVLRPFPANPANMLLEDLVLLSEHGRTGLIDKLAEDVYGKVCRSSDAPARNRGVAIIWERKDVAMARALLHAWKRLGAADSQWQRAEKSAGRTIALQRVSRAYQLINEGLIGPIDERPWSSDVPYFRLEGDTLYSGNAAIVIPELPA